MKWALSRHRSGLLKPTWLLLSAEEDAGVMKGGSWYDCFLLVNPNKIRHHCLPGRTNYLPICKPYNKYS